MKIKTKYNIGDTVYFIRDNVIQCNSVKSIDITVYYSGAIGVYYVFNECSGFLTEYNISEDRCFNSRSDLVDSL